MILELLEYLSTPCPKYARKLGHLKEAIAIGARQKRLAGAWAPHLEQSQAIIREAAEQCERRRVALILGSGLLLDIPLADLSRQFEHVVLADVVHLRAARRKAAEFANVTLVEEDVTGMAADFDFRVSSGWQGDPVPNPAVFLDRPEVDLVVSANLLAQLPIFLAAALQRRTRLDGEPLEDFCRAVIEAHLAYLRRFDAVACLITEVERSALDKDRVVVQRHDALYGAELPHGGTQWNWELAPLGEVSRTHALRNRVVGFRDIGKQ